MTRQDTVGARVTLIESHYKLCSGKPILVDGAEFKPYRHGICRYTRISSDGCAQVNKAGSNGSTYVAITLTGYVKSENGKPKRFRTFEAAARAALKTAGGE